MPRARLMVVSELAGPARSVGLETFWDMPRFLSAYCGECYVALNAQINLTHCG